MLKTDDVLADILIVDDDSSIVIALNKALKNIGRIRFASNAEQAFAMINDKSPDLILLDVELPDMSGLDVCLKIKKEPDIQNVPVLFITGHIEVGFEEKVFDAGAADFIQKPLKPRVVAARVETHLSYHRAMDLLNELAHTDAMTSLANRRAFDEQLIIELSRSHREQHPLTIAILDIDEFKKYNDYFGHIEGDDCIKKIASALNSENRRKTDLAARYGGEEFALILPNTGVEGAGKHLHALLNAIEALGIPHSPEAGHEVVTVSIGYSTITPSKMSASELDDWDVVKVADHALYQSKQSGRNCVSYVKIDEVLNSPGDNI